MTPAPPRTVRRSSRTSFTHAFLCAARCADTDVDMYSMRVVGRYVAAKFRKHGLPTVEPPTPVSEKRCPAPVHFFLFWLRKPPSERGTTDVPRRESEDVVPPITTYAVFSPHMITTILRGDRSPLSHFPSSHRSQTTTSRGPSALRGSKQASHPFFANSRSTYAHTSLYESQNG